MRDFSDKIAVVTGGGSGIGREIVRQLAAAGSRVAMCDLSVDSMQQTIALVGEETSEAEVLAHRADVSDEAQLAEFRDVILAGFDTDHVHLLFNNAGIAAPAAFLVNTSSVNGFYASIGPDLSHTAYSAAKFAVKGFSEALITDLRLNAPHVKVAVVMPGDVGTQLVRNTVRAQVDEPSPELAKLHDAVALDERVRTDPSTVYDETLFTLLE